MDQTMQLEQTGQVFLRGQIWFANFPYDFKRSDGVLSVTRPVLILSNNTINKDFNRILVAPLTREKLSASPFHLIFSFNRDRSVLLMDNMKTVNRGDFTTYQYTLNEEMMAIVEDSLQMVTGLKELPEDPLEEINLDTKAFDLDNADEDSSDLSIKENENTEPSLEDMETYLVDYELTKTNKRSFEEFRKRWNLSAEDNLEEIYSRYEKSIEE